METNSVQVLTDMAPYLISIHEGVAVCVFAVGFIAGLIVWLKE